MPPPPPLPPPSEARPLPRSGLWRPFVFEDSNGTDGLRTLVGSTAVDLGLTDLAGLKPGRCFRPGDDCVNRDLLFRLVLLLLLLFVVDGGVVVEADMDGREVSPAVEMEGGSVVPPSDNGAEEYTLVGWSGLLLAGLVHLISLLLLPLDETGATSHCECMEAWFMASSERVDGVLLSSEIVLWYVFWRP